MTPPLPASESVEAELLAACMLDDGQTARAALAAGVSTETFHFHPHRTVFRTIARLVAQNVPSFDPATLVSSMDAEDLQGVGGWQFINALSRAAPTTALAKKNTAAVLELAARRRIAKLGDALALHARNGYTIDELNAELASALTAAPGLSTPIAASALCASPPKTPPELITGILYEESTMLVSGPSKAKKTFTAFDIGISIAAGIPWLSFPTAQCPVLDLNLELQDFAAADRLAKICAARAISPPKDLHIWNLRGHKVDLLYLEKALPQAIRQLGAKAVCIDPHYKISSSSGMEENSNDDQGLLLQTLESICLSEKASLIITHHFAKGDASSKNQIDRASGGGVFARWGDVMLTFTPHEDPDCMTVEMALRNFAPVQPFVVRWQYPRWVRDVKMNPANLKRANGGKFQQQVAPDDLLDVLGSQLLTATEWLKQSGLSERTFFRKRTDLVNAGKVVLSANCYRKADPSLPIS